MKPATLREIERRKLERLDFMAKLKRDRAIAAYYKIKCKLLKLQIKRLQLINKQLRLEKEVLKKQEAENANKTQNESNTEGVAVVPLEIKDEELI